MPELAKKVPLILISEPVKNAPNSVTPLLESRNKRIEEESVLDIKNTADLEKNYPQLVNEIRDAADGAAYTRGVEAERARVKALDGLAGPGREALIAKAKYEEPKDARDIAMELLQASARVAELEARRSDAAVVNDVLVPSVTLTAQEAIDNAAAKIADEINGMRGYKK
jgi:hypothetical protein